MRFCGVCSADSRAKLGDVEAHLGACASSGRAGPPAEVLKLGDVGAVLFIHVDHFKYVNDNFGP